MRGRVTKVKQIKKVRKLSKDEKEKLNRVKAELLDKSINIDPHTPWREKPRNKTCERCRTKEELEK